MDTKIIYLDEEDDIVSICDRLDWSGERRALLVLPPGGAVLREGMDMVRLRRHADRLRLDVGLVTADTALRRQANGLGIPTFLSTTTASQSRRGWWRARRRRERVGLPTIGGSGVTQLRPGAMAAGDREEVSRRLAPRVSWQRWLIRYAAIFLFFITMALLVVAFTYAVPTATIVLQPETMPVRASRVVLADPALITADYARGAVPARQVIVSNLWQASVATTGAIEVPNASARGQVLFVNLLEQEVTIPAGTRVSTSGGNNIVFQTVVEATVAGVEGSTVEIDVIAIDPGVQGNVATNLINRIEGPLAAQLEVRNLEAMSGGAVRFVPAAAEADRTRLRAQVLQFLQALATSEIEAQLTEREFLAQESLRVDRVTSETYSHFSGERTNDLALEMRADLQGTAIDTTEAAGLLYEALAAEVPDGFNLVTTGLTFTVGEVVGVDDEGRVTFTMIGEGVAAADLQLTGPIDRITGQEPSVAAAYLFDELPLRATPLVEIWPTWFGRIPFVTTRIDTEVSTGN